MSIPTGFKPLNDNLLIRRIESQTQTSGGLYLPESSQEKPQIAVVEAANAVRYDDDGNEVKVAVEKGDKILFGKYSGQTVNFDGEEYIIIKESELLAVVRD